MFSRSSGILLHLTSLPGPYGIGSLGQTAMDFIDFLSDAGQSYWQILPLVPTGEGNSPYMSPSSAAGNPALIDLDELHKLGLLTREELDSCRCDAPDRVDYGFVQRTHAPLLRRAYDRATPALRSQAEAFAAQHTDWLADYALFMACHEKFGTGLTAWPDEDLIRRRPEALKRYAAELADEVRFHSFLQFLFYTQWDRLKQYANEKGVKIIGDMPFYVSGDSVDVWVQPELFQVDEVRVSKLVAGVPPDMFSEDGQFWGNPIYNWPRHAADHYAWWVNRVRMATAFYDVIRFDHFRGFDTYWEIPVEAKSAKEGRWREGPGMLLLDELRRQVPQAQFIAEDLGDLTPSAVAFIHKSGLPGLRVMTDAFYDLGGSSSFLPHNCIPDAIMYTGTHDTPTFVEWLFAHANDAQRRYAMEYLRLNEQEGYGWGVIRGAWGSVCCLAIAPFQDVLGLGGDARMNTPGTLGDHNWSWRVRKEALNPQVAHQLHHLTWLYGRTKR
ncbi:MAG: 4-alpha-glucanotransferase [Oscillospiraceae bacterium]|nr:4-alpha-glucanotransferase [Oscillospiraceae bacterium]